MRHLRVLDLLAGLVVVLLYVVVLTRGELFGLVPW